MHFAPSMMLSGMARSGADIIWLRTVLAVWMRSRSAARLSDAAAELAIEKSVSSVITVFFIARLR